jgi:hypothetical protein
MTAHGEPVPGDPGAGDSAIIFLHIGKTAGTTMRWILRRQYPASRILVTKNRTLRGEDPDPTRLPREDTLKYFASLPDADRRHASLIMAHTVFGIHEFFPQPCAYFTLLRAPVALTLSQYSYIAGKTNHRLHEQAASRTLEAFISSGVALQTDNSQTRAISGDTTTPFGECTSEMLDRAKTNIEGWFPVVGLTERFDETLLLLRQAFGWRKLHYARANVTPQRKRPPIPEPTRRLIEEQNRFDMELYSWATERFEASITSMPGFDDELARFQRGNKLYEPWGRLTYTFPKRMAGHVRAAR